MQVRARRLHGDHNRHVERRRDVHRPGVHREQQVCRRQPDDQRVEVRAFHVHDARRGRMEAKPELRALDAAGDCLPGGVGHLAHGVGFAPGTDEHPGARVEIELRPGQFALFRRDAQTRLAVRGRTEVDAERSKLRVGRVHEEAVHVPCADVLLLLVSPIEINVNVTARRSDNGYASAAAKHRMRGGMRFKKNLQSLPSQLVRDHRSRQHVPQRECPPHRDRLSRNLVTAALGW